MEDVLLPTTCAYSTGFGMEDFIKKVVVEKNCRKKENNLSKDYSKDYFSFVPYFLLFWAELILSDEARNRTIVRTVFLCSLFIQHSIIHTYNSIVKTYYVFDQWSNASVNTHSFQWDMSFLFEPRGEEIHITVWIVTVNLQT